MSIQRIKSGVIADNAVTSEKFASSLTLPANVAVTNGIAFPATQSASSDANTLDDYEEGTWTPTNDGGMNGFTAINGTYTKVGRLVTVRGSYSFTQITTNVRIAGLPFVSLAGGRYDSVVFNDFPVSTNFRAVIANSARIEWNVAATGSFNKTVEFTAWYFSNN
jgi:hypothetical protein